MKNIYVLAYLKRVFIKHIIGKHLKVYNFVNGCE